MTGFVQPLWLLGLLIIPVLILYALSAEKKRRKQALQFSRVSIARAAMNGHNRVQRPTILLAILLCAIALIFIGLADPQIPLEHTTEGVNVVLVMDISGSMEAGDYQPTRLEAAKEASVSLIHQLDPKDAVGVVTFESGAASAAYISPNHNRVIDKIKRIEGKTGSTAIGDGLALGIDMVLSLPNNHRVIILLSDGENNAGYISPEDAMALAKENNIQIYTVGIGSETPVLLGYDWFGRPQYTSLDEETLRLLADETGGTYVRSVDEHTLDAIYQSLPDSFERETEETGIGYLFFILAILLLIGEFFLRYGRGRIIQ